jgi:hypothetical protein
VRALLKTFPVRGLGNHWRILQGIVLERDHAARSNKLTRPELLRDMVELLSLQQATRRETPLPAGAVVEIGTTRTLDAVQLSVYLTVLGKLEYMAQTWPGIVFVANGLARIQQRATAVHMHLLKYVPRQPPLRCAHRSVGGASRRGARPQVPGASGARRAPPRPGPPARSLRFLGVISRSTQKWLCYASKVVFGCSCAQKPGGVS